MAYASERAGWRAARAGLPAAALLLLLAWPVRAGCGLSFCPKPEEPGSRNLELGVMARQTGFDIRGTSGSYSEIMGTAQYTAWERLALGVHLPFLLLSAGGRSEAGLGNAIAYAEWRARPHGLSAFGAGVQLELPTGASGKGLAGDHFMAVPYFSLALPSGPLMLGAALGAAVSVYGDHAEAGSHAGHAHAPAPVYVHPHEHAEFLYRFSAGARLLQGRFLPEIFLDGQRVIGDTEAPGAGTDFLAAGASLPFEWKSLVVSPNAALPVLPDRRFEWSAGVTLGWKLGLGVKRNPYGET